MTTLKNKQTKLSFLTILLIGLFLILFAFSLISNASALFIISDSETINISGLSNTTYLDNFTLVYNTSVSGQVLAKRNETVSITYTIMDAEGEDSALTNANTSFVTYLDIKMNTVDDQYSNYIDDYIINDNNCNIITYETGTYFASNVSLYKQTFERNSNNEVHASSNVVILRSGSTSTVYITLSESCPIDELLLEFTFTSSESSDYEYAYIYGDMNNWSATEYYKMTPNLYATSYFEWMWVASDTNISANVGFKCYSNSASYCCYNSNHTSSTEVNVVYWQGYNAYYDTCSTHYDYQS